MPERGGMDPHWWRGSGRLEAAGARAKGRPEVRGSWRSERLEPVDCPRADCLPPAGGAVGGGWRQPELERRGDREWRWCRSTEHGGSAAGRAAAAASGVTPVGSLRRALAMLWWIERMEREAGGRWGGRG